MTEKANSQKILIVTQQSEVDRLCAQCRKEGRFAFDTEFVMEDCFEADVCLIQLATEKQVAIIDPLLDLDLTPFWELNHDDGVEVVVHAGMEDLGISVQFTNRAPRNILDLQIAAGFCGYGYPLSLQRLIQQTLHVRLHKAKTLTDWRRRPLGDDQIKYAAEDVSHLLAVRDKLIRRLNARDRMPWVQEEMRRFENILLYQRAEEEKMIRLKGAGSLQGVQLAVLRDVLAWREQLARELNRPARIVLRDHLLVEVAKLGLHTHKEIRDLRGINLSDRQIRNLCDVVSKASSTPKLQWPKPIPRDNETPTEISLIPLLTAVIQSHCTSEDIAYGLVGSKKRIRALIRHVTEQESNDVELLSGWRKSTIGRTLAELLSGERTVRIGSTNGQPTLLIE